MNDPKLRTVIGVKEPYKLGTFPDNFIHNLAGALSAELAIGRGDVEGKTWERIFAEAINAKWQPSVVGLDDILIPELSAAWGAKTIKNVRPFTAQRIRLISGRNSINYSYGISDIKSLKPIELGELVLSIWNERVAALYKKYKTLRTVVLIKGPMLEKVSVFEIPTIRYNFSEYKWSWNKNDNLIAKDKAGLTSFTWQPHGSQFTIHESVPDYALNITLNKPENITTEQILKTISFDTSCYKSFYRNHS